MLICEALSRGFRLSKSKGLVKRTALNYSTMTSTNQLRVVKAIEDQAQSHLLKPNTHLDRAIANSRAKGLPEITISALQGKQLALQCKLMNAKSVLEIGTLGGYSTIWFAQTGAKVTSIELNPKHRDVALENTKGLDVEIILGAALDVMPKLAAEGKTFDFVFIDADWGEQWDYFQWAVKLARPKGCIYVDNVVRELAENLGTGESLLTKVGREKKVDATLISTVSGQKSSPGDMFDGFLLAVVEP